MMKPPCLYMAQSSPTQDLPIVVADNEVEATPRDKLRTDRVCHKDGLYILTCLPAYLPTQSGNIMRCRIIIVFFLSVIVVVLCVVSLCVCY